MARAKEILAQAEVTDVEAKENVKLQADLDALLAKLKVSKSFIFFAGILSDKKDEHGDQLIDFSYMRQKFTFDDASESVRAFKKHLVEDIQGSISKA